MAERKQTPDILGDVLTGGAVPPAPAEPKPKPKPKPKPAPARATRAADPKPRTRKRSSRAKPKPVQWEYREIVFRDYGGYRPRYVDGQEQPDWKQAPVIHEYLNQLGAEGWELVGVGGRSDREMPAYFKRQKK